MEKYYNKHYIVVDEKNNIADAWSDGPSPDRDTSGAICINEQGGYQFRLFPDGVENPQLISDGGVCLYRYVNGGIMAKTAEEIEAETPAPVTPVTLEAIKDYQMLNMELTLGVIEILEQIKEGDDV